jgi:hypothetical protein
MNEEQITAVAKVLAKWNPLATAAQEVPDLDGYRIEAGDITSSGSRYEAVP